MNYRLFRYQGVSMAPGLQDDDRLITEGVDAQRLRVGDVVVFRSAGQPAGLCCHRLFWKRRANGVLKLYHLGDAQRRGFGYCTSDQLIGRVRWFLRDRQLLGVPRTSPRQVMRFWFGAARRRWRRWRMHPGLRASTR